MPTCHFKLV
uniref:Uncharacterized protein n=1 Tax=Moniliophthora roreri TaxID=221103 RepID=A0A0W0FP05_MONRR